MDLFRQLYECIRPALQGLFSPGIPFHLRWRMVGCSLILSLVMPMNYLPWLFSKAYTVHMIPNRHGHKLRALVFQPPQTSSSKDANQLRPLHLSIHGGAFIGGNPESCAEWAAEVSRRTGAVVVCSTYRFAPKDAFPAAHDDTDDVVAYLLENAERLWNADPRLLTVSGLSAGGNLAMATAQQEGTRQGDEFSIKGSVTFYAPIDLRVPPWEKPKPAGFPTYDPLKFMMPLYDAYPGPVRAANMENYRLNPCIAPLDMLPENMLFVIPMIDILPHEQLKAAARINDELGPGSDRRMETLIVEGQIHGWIELPHFAITKETKVNAFDTGIAFLRKVHSKHGFFGGCK